MKVILGYTAHRKGAQDPFVSLLPIGLGYINALLRTNGINSLIVNFSGMGRKEIEALFRHERPDILGLSVFTHNRFESVRLAEVAKAENPSCFIAAGGPHATHRYREILQSHPAIDAVVLGEGEETFLDLVRWRTTQDVPGGIVIPGLAIRDGGDIIRGPVRPLLPKLDSLPFPGRFFDDAIGIDVRRQLEFIITSRGCPASCVFCS